MFRTKFVDRRSVDKIHHEVRQAIRSGPSIHDAGYVDVIETRQDFPLLAESLQQSIGRYFRADDLNRADTMEYFIRPNRLVNDAHAAAAQFPKNFIRAYERAGLSRRGRCFTPLPGRGIENSGAALLGCQQPSNRIQKLLVALAGPCQE